MSLQELNDKIEGLVNSERKLQDEVDAKLAKGIEAVAENKEKVAKVEADLNEALSEKRAFEKDMSEKMDNVMAAINRGVDGGAQSEQEAMEKKAAFNSAIVKMARSGNMKNYSLLNELELKTLQAGIDPDGGYTVTNMIEGIKTRQFDTSPIRSVASVATIGGSQFHFLIDDDEMAYANSSETGTRSNTATAQFGQGTIDVHEYYMNIPVTLKLLEDSDLDIMSWAGQKAMDRFARAEAADFVAGDGVGKAKGFITETVKTASPRAYAQGQVGTLDTAGATAITADELVNVRSYLKGYYRPNAMWAFNSLTEAYIRKIKDGDGNYLWQPSYQQGEAETLLGQRILLCEDMPDIATGVIAVALADFRECYQIVDKVGVSLLDDPYTNKGFRQLFFRKRVGGGVCNWDGIKYLRQA